MCGIQSAKEFTKIYIFILLWNVYYIHYVLIFVIKINLKTQNEECTRSTNMLLNFKIMF